MITTNEIKLEISSALGISKDEIKCSNCKYWGGNNQKAVSSVGGSRCSIRKESTLVNQFCRKFEVK